MPHSVRTDSHRASQLEFMELGVAAALNAKLDPKRILNYLPTDQLLEWAESVRNH
jgi:histidinol phosphatase-like PHP family hydrolase